MSKYFGFPKPVIRYKHAQPTGNETVLWESSKNMPAGMWYSSDYSDRLLQWDRDKHDALCEKHFGNRGQAWHQRSHDKIELFLQEYHGYSKVILMFVVQGKNVSNGYSYWVLGYAYREK